MKGFRNLASLIYRCFVPLDKVKMYRKMGVKIGDGCIFRGTSMLDYSHYWLIEIGCNVRLATGVHIMAHDGTMAFKNGYGKIAKVIIEDNVSIGVNSIILPGIKIGKNTIIGAGSIVTKNIPENSIATGNPARVIGRYDEFINKHRENLKTKPVFSDEYKLQNVKNNREKMQKMKDILGDDIGYI